MKYVPPKKLKVLMIMFFAAAGFGIFTGLVVSNGMQGLIITFLGVVNLCLGGFMGYLLLLQKPKVRDSRKRE
jgi:hypothetical protein